MVPDHRHPTSIGVNWFCDQVRRLLASVSAWTATSHLCAPHGGGLGHLLPDQVLLISWSDFVSAQGYGSTRSAATKLVHFGKRLALLQL